MSNFDGFSYYSIPAASTSSSQHPPPSSHQPRGSGRGRGLIARPAHGQRPPTHHGYAPQQAHNMHAYSMPQQAWPFNAGLPQKPGSSSAPMTQNDGYAYPPQAAYANSFNMGYGMSPTANTFFNANPPAMAAYAAPPQYQAAFAGPAHSRPPLESQASVLQSQSQPTSRRPFCDNCQMSFPSSVQLIAHTRNLHVKCSKHSDPVHPCRFEGLPAVVETHEQDRHLIFRPGAKKEATKPDGPLGYV